MDGATLRLLDQIRGVSFPGGPHTPTALEAFARLLYGRPRGQDDLHWLESIALDAHRSSTVSRAEPFRVIYETVRARGQRLDLADAAHAGALALEGLMLLPLRDRAALALSCVLGFDAREVGHVLGMTPLEAHALVDAAVAAVRREAGVRPARSDKRATPAA